MNWLSVLSDSAAKRVLLLSGGGCLAIFLFSIPLPHADDHLVGSDGLRYFAILRSLVMDGDFNFSNDYALLDIPGHGISAKGLPQCPFALGTPLLWAPFYLVAHLLSLLLQAAGLSVPVNGIGYIYEAAACIATIFYATAGLLLCYLSARRAFAVAPALLATLALFGASPAIYYVIAEPSMSHGCSLFANALFLFLWFRPGSTRTLFGCFGLGLAMGLVALVRWQEAVLVAIPLVEWGHHALRRNISARTLLARLGVFFPAMALAFAPQMWMWAEIYGSPITLPQGAGFMRWTDPHPFLTLFSLRHGLITWHPVFLLALMGIPLLWREHRALALAALWIFLMQLYINSAAHTWWGDDAFGGRRFIGVIPWLIPALAAWSLPALRLAARPALAGMLVLLSWNALSLAQYRLGYIPKSESPTLRQMTIERLLLPVEVLKRR